ncbi:MAG: TRAP transporter large permease subunit [Dehalococcoidales bacterium]|nr:TRAP transporter large permease subunit [Dehalococcoidales bacterium]
MSIELITLLMFVSLIVLLLTGLPLAFTLGSIAVGFAIWLWGIQSLYTFPSIMFAGLNNFILVALPLFILMANVLERSGLAEQLYATLYKWTGAMGGGLAIGTIVVCTIFAAMSGITGAACVTMGLIALPSMLKFGYNKDIALGSVGAGSALGTLIPPSITMVIYAYMTGDSVGKMFAGGVFPGVLLSGLFMLYIGIRCRIQPHMGPPLPIEERATWKEKFISLRNMIPAVVLIGLVLGTIFTGIATPSEAAAVGALGAIIIALFYRNLKFKDFKEAGYRTINATCMVMIILVGANIFTNVYIALGAPDIVKSFILDLPIGKYGVLIMMQLSLFLLGCLLDPTGIIMITVPVYVPIIRALGFDSVWFAVLFIVNMEMSYLTPPFGFNLFYLKSVAPGDITMGDIYRSVWPFVALQAVGLALCMIFPQIILWLPRVFLG